MSFSAMAWAAKVKTHTPTQKLILLLLADRSNDDGFCWPSLQRIADDACISRQCVIENIKKLAAHGFINVTKRTINDAECNQEKNLTNIYRLNIGVVNEVDHPSQLGLLGVVNEVDPNLSIEPIKEVSVLSSSSNTERNWALGESRKLIDGVSKKLNHKLTSKPSAEPILQLLKIVTQKEVSEMVDFVISNSGKKYFPDVQSSMALKEKWDKLLSAKNRITTKPSKPFLNFEKRWRRGEDGILKQVWVNRENQTEEEWAAQ